MKRTALALLAITLVVGGCLSAGLPSKPKNWFQRAITLDFRKNPVEKVEQARKGDEEAREALLDKAHEAAFATNEAIDKIPVGIEQELAARFSNETMGALDVALGALEPGKKAELVLMLEGLSQPLETDAGFKARAEFIRWQASVAETAAIKREWEADKAKWEAKSGEWAKERDAVARKWESMWFWIWLIAGGYVLVAWVLPVLGKVFPALGAVTTISQGVIAPFAVGALHKTKRVLGDVVSGVEEVRKVTLNKFPDARAAVNATLREYVTEADGTAAEVDAIRREKGLL